MMSKQMFVYNLQLSILLQFQGNLEKLKVQIEQIQGIFQVVMLKVLNCRNMHWLSPVRSHQISVVLSNLPTLVPEMVEAKVVL